MIKKKFIVFIILLALLPLVFITGQSSWLLLEEVGSDIENKYYPISITNSYEATYDGNFKEISVNDVSSETVAFDSSKVKIEYFDKLDNGFKGSKRSNAPVNAGSYFADTYYDNTLIGTTDILIKPYPIYVMPNDSEITYGDKLESLNPGYKLCKLENSSYVETNLFTNKESNTKDTLDLNISYTYTYTNYAKAGSYKIGIRINNPTELNKNYSVTAPSDSNLNVNKKHLSFSWDQLEYEYDGKVHNPSITINNNLASPNALNPKITGSVSKDVGTYPVTLEKEYDNFILDGDAALFNKNVVIKQKDICKNISWVSVNLVYDGTPKAPFMPDTNIINGDDVHFMYEYYSGESKLSIMPVNAGSYKVKLVGISGVDSKNYSFTPSEKTFTIAKGTPTLPDSLPVIEAYKGDLITSIESSLPSGFRLDGYTNQLFGSVGVVDVNIIYNPDSNNYNDLKATIKVNVVDKSLNSIYITATNTTYTYDGNPHSIDYQIYVNGVPGSLPGAATMTINFGSGKVNSLTDVGTYTVQAITINNLPSDYTYDDGNLNNSFKGKKLIINPMEVSLSSSLFELGFNASSRNFAQISTSIKGILKFKNNGSEVNINASDITIIGMHNGVYSYGKVDRARLDTTMTNVVGSTYKVMFSLGSNYKITESSFILKYKTAKCGNTLYTIEDAILSGSGEINFTGDATSTTTYVTTSFTRLTLEEGNPYNNGVKIRDYFEVNRNLVVPYGPNCNGSGDKTNRTHDPAGTIDAVYSALVIPYGVKVEFTGGSVLSIGAVVDHTAKVTQRGVILNEGTINMRSGTKVDCYGYLKGKNGIVNLEKGSTAVDCMRMYDWPGGNNASQIYSNLFPLSRWSLHNISCRTRINAGAEYIACAFIEVSIKIDTVEFEKFITVLGKENDTDFLFKPTDSSSYIEKYSKPADEWAKDNKYYDTIYSITGSNQNEGQEDVIELNGNFIDGNLSLTINAFIIKVVIGTSLDKSLPLSYISVVARSGTNLKLTKSDYLFLPGTSFTVEKGAQVTIGAGVDMAFATKQSITRTDNTSSSFIKLCDKKENAQLILNGELICNGNIGGDIISIEKGATLNIKGSKTTANFQLLNGVSGTIWFNSSVVAQGRFKSKGPMVNLANNVYISDGTGEESYWVEASNVHEFVLNFYDDDGTFLTSKSIAVINVDKYVITGEEYIPSKLHHSFLNWVAMDGSSIVGTEFVLGDEIKMKAQWDLVHYTFNYTAGYGILENEDVNYIQATYGPDLETVNRSFTVNDFVNDRLDILTTATFEDKYFDGWYFGVDKRLGVKTTFLTRSLLDKMATDIPGLTEIPLFCDFTDSISVKYVVNHPDPNHSDIKFNDSIVSGDELLTLPNLHQFDSNISELYYFAGWYDNKLFEGNPIDGSVLIKQNTILYAKWVKKLSIKFYTGTALNKELNVTTNGVIETASYYYVPGSDTVLACEVPAEKGHTLMGWSNTNVTDGTYQYAIGSINTTSFTTDKVLYASYKRETVQVTIDNKKYDKKDRPVRDIYLGNTELVDGQTYNIEYGSSITINVWNTTNPFITPPYKCDIKSRDGTVLVAYSGEYKTLGGVKTFNYVIKDVVDIIVHGYKV